MKVRGRESHKGRSQEKAETFAGVRLLRCWGGGSQESEAVQMGGWDLQDTHCYGLFSLPSCETQSSGATLSFDADRRWGEGRGKAQGGFLDPRVELRAAPLRSLVLGNQRARMASPSRSRNTGCNQGRRGQAGLQSS